MRKHLPIVGFWTLLGLGTFVLALPPMASALEIIVSWSEQQLRLFQIVVTAVLAFAGFFTGTAVKDWFDRRLDRDREEKARKALALALLTEVRVLVRSIKSMSTVVESFRGDPDFNTGELHHTVRQGVAVARRPVYEGTVGRLGLLGPRTADLLVTIYANYDNMEHILGTMRSLPVSPGAFFDSIDIVLQQFAHTNRASIVEADKRLSAIAGEEFDPKRYYYLAKLAAEGSDKEPETEGAA